MITNITRKTIIASHVKITKNPLERMKGLLGTKSLPQGQALVITKCQSIHMMFMTYAIDAIFIDKECRVVGLCQNIKPFYFSPIFFRADQAIEVPAGSIAATQTQVGDILSISNTN
jgi:uncharacterized protein